MNEILTKFYKLRPDLDVRANDGFLIEKAEKPISIPSLLVAAHQLEDTLLLTLAYQSAWDEFVFYNPEKKSTAFLRQFLEEMRQKEQKYEYDSLLKELGREDLRGIPLEDVREIAATQRENNRRKSLPVPQLRELSRLERPVPQPNELPQLYTPFGKKEAVELTAQVLQDAGKRNAALSVYDLKFLVHRYGSKVNERIGVKPTVQPGYIKKIGI
jgi:hypothetical protein